MENLKHFWNRKIKNFQDIFFYKIKNNIFYKKVKNLNIYFRWSIWLTLIIIWLLFLFTPLPWIILMLIWLKISFWYKKIKSLSLYFFNKSWLRKLLVYLIVKNYMNKNYIYK